MAKRKFFNDKNYIHIPIHDVHPENGNYIKVYDGNTLANEFHMTVSSSADETDFYVALYLGNYKSENITLECDDGVPETFFESFIQGKKPEEEKELYPNLYSEPTRQQIHFSPRCGWMNDMNGLFFKDGKFNVYFQHNPFGSRHGGVNVSWGHTVSEDAVHFTEYPDAIMPYSSRCLVASGSAYVDNNNISGKGKGTILAAYTALQSLQYRGRKKVTQNEGQMLLYSTDDGMTFDYFENNPIIPVPEHEEWRDPKIFEKDGTLFAIVYEPENGNPSTSFYSSTDCKDWKLASKGGNFHECPDFFPLEVENEDKTFYVMYGGHGKYSIGTFENFEFTSVQDGLFLDYGDSLYAGQTFANSPDTKYRYHLAWLKDRYLCCCIDPDYVFGGVGFNQSASLMTKLSLRKTEFGYRIFRKPHENLVKLRSSESEVVLTSSQMLDIPAEYVFTLDTQSPVTFSLNGRGFTYNPAERSFETTCGKKYFMCTRQAPKIRMFVDKRSVEYFVSDEIGITFFATPQETPLLITGAEKISATKHKLNSIWK